MRCIKKDELVKAIMKSNKAYEAVVSFLNLAAEENERWQRT